MYYSLSSDLLTKVPVAALQLEYPYTVAVPNLFIHETLCSSPIHHHNNQLSLETTPN